MTHSIWQDFKIHTQTSQLKKYDFVIIGGGVAGLSVAYWLQKENAKYKIAIIEKNEIGSGATGKNAGFVTCGSIEHFIKLSDQFGLEKAVEIWHFSEVNRQLLQDHIIEGQADELDYKMTGACTVAASSERWAYYQEVIQTLCSQKIDVHSITANELEKDYGVTGFEGGVVYSNDGYIHPLKLLNRVLQKVKVHIHEMTEVHSFQKNNGTNVIQTNQGRLEADQIIVTVNAYLPLLHPQFLKIITPGRGQILLTEPLPQFVRGPCYLTKHLCYFRQLPTGELLIGGFRNLATDIEKTYTDSTTELIQNALYDFTKTHFHEARNAQIKYRWSGIMGYSPDGQMLIGQLNVDSSIHYLAGCSGHGLGLSFNAGKTLVDAIFNKEIPSHLDIKRFKI